MGICVKKKHTETNGGRNLQYFRQTCILCTFLWRNLYYIHKI